MRLAAALLATALLALAGCSSSPGTSSSSSSSMPPAPLATDSYHLTVDGVPATVQHGMEFTFNVTVQGASGRSSDHIGAHFGANSTTSPSTTIYNVTCSHQFSALPGVFHPTCKAPTTPGLYFLRGHTRIIEDNKTYQWWSDEKSFTVV